ncbi:MAG: hypothetical protein Q4E82_05385 [Peptococcaceae bacterium]|nr:hypothetical protein [Peptococcaceae bacterium]
MIYTKKANFPYPVLMNFSDDYQDPEFSLDVMIKDNTDDFLIEVAWDISSDYIYELLKTGKANLYLIIKSKDNQFFKLQPKKKTQQSIPKRKLCIHARTTMQLMVQAAETLEFSDNNDLNTFYDAIKEEIQVKAGNVLAFSNTVIFDGEQNKPYDLFEKQIDSDINSDVEIRLGAETILVVYKNEQYQFAEVQNSKELNYPYLYLGLQKALISFLMHANPDNPDEGVDVEEMEPPENALESKLYSLMQSKNISELSMENIDEVIYKISDNLIMKYHNAVRGMHNGD